ncbi:MAG: hypothetical protein KDD16_08615 [Mangrovimonas sp.]|nr:hypothetical protein [Mangrovimonas sp.]
MKVVESSLFTHVVSSYSIVNGTVYFFENYYILEMTEGANVTFDNSRDLLELVNKHYGENQQFGIISNRVNSYSSNILDSDKFILHHKNAAGKAVVTYSKNSSINFELESHFCKLNKKEFNSLYEAIHWIEDLLNINRKTAV